MTDRPAQSDDQLPTPGPAGRAIRLGIGILLLLWLSFILIDHETGQIGDFSQLIWWLGVAYSFYSLPDVGYLPWGRRANRRAQGAAALIALAAVLFDLVHTGEIIGTTLAAALLIIVTYAMGVGGLSFVLAGLFAVPG